MNDRKIVPVIHFNDVYKMTRPHAHDMGGKFAPVIRDGELTNRSYSHVVKFANKIKDIRHDYGTDAHRGSEYNSLLLFSGDLFSASVESLLTRGRNMVHLMNELAPDASVPGNHEFDYGRQRFNELVEFCNFPWLLSNIEEYEVNKAQEPDHNKIAKIDGLRKYLVVERCGLRIGILGLISDDTLMKTNTQSKVLFATNSMTEEWGPEDDSKKWTPVQQLVAHLRKPTADSGEGCDLVFALTHALVHEDIALAKQAGAFLAGSGSGQRLEDLRGIDVIFGGHDHHYWLGDGVTLSEGPDFTRTDSKDMLIVKSGTDFEDLSEVMIEVEKRPAGTKRKHVVTSVTVKRHNFKPIKKPQDAADPRKLNGSPLSNRLIETDKTSMNRVLKRQLDDEVLAGLKSAVAMNPNLVEINEFQGRSKETIIGNWIADVMLGWYDHLWDGEEAHRPRAFILSAGSVRGKRNLEVGTINADDIIELLPFESPLAALEIEGRHLKTALDGAFATMKKRDGIYTSGAFPVVSGMRVEWREASGIGAELANLYIANENQQLEEVIDSQIYRILTDQYLADGNDGYGGRDGQSGFKAGKPIQLYEEIPSYQVLLYHLNDLSAARAHDITWAAIGRQAVHLTQGLEEKLGDGLRFLVNAVMKLGKLYEQKQKKAIMRTRPTKRPLYNLNSKELPELDIDNDPTHLGQRVVHVADRN